MDVPDLPLSAAEDLLRTYGDAANIGATVRRWRAERIDKNGKPNPMAQEELQEKLGISQSTLSRIESPKPESVHRVTIKVALDLCRAFDKPLIELLLPAAQGALLDGWSAFREATEALNDMRNANNRYADLMDRVRARLSVSPELNESIQHYLRDSLAYREAKIRRIWEIEGGTKGDQPIYEKYAPGFRGPTAAIVSANDALAGERPNRNLWAVRDFMEDSNHE
ncbi:MAG: hypothetical protein JWQ47_827 [Glaciihabitans sp.]|nr:hypothetical protein [Glaciihabitans sp.]